MKLQFSVPIELANKFRARCQNEGLQGSDVLRAAIEEYVYGESRPVSVSKNNNQFRIKLPKGLSQKFVGTCEMNKTTQRRAMENLIRKWLQEKQ